MELRKHGGLLRLQEQPFRVLAILAARPRLFSGAIDYRFWNLPESLLSVSSRIHRLVNR